MGNFFCDLTGTQEGKLLEMKTDDPNSRKRLLVYDYCFPLANFNSDEY